MTFECSQRTKTDSNAKTKLYMKVLTQRKWNILTYRNKQKHKKGLPCLSHTQIYTDTYYHTYTHIKPYTYMHTNTHALYTRSCTCKPICPRHISEYTYSNTHTYTETHLHTQTYTQTHTHTHTY